MKSNPLAQKSLLEIPSTHSKEATFLEQVKQQILLHLEEETFKAPQLAKVLAMSESQLYRKLKAVTNQSTAKYIQIIRLIEAQKLVQTKEFSISEVAYKVGFKQVSHFSKAFKLHFGHSPSANVLLTEIDKSLTNIDKPF